MYIKTVFFFWGGGGGGGGEGLYIYILKAINHKIYIVIQPLNSLVFKIEPSLTSNVCFFLILFYEH